MSKTLTLLHKIKYITGFSQYYFIVLRPKSGFLLSSFLNKCMWTIFSSNKIWMPSRAMFFNMVMPPSAGSIRSLQQLTAWFVLILSFRIEFSLIYEECLCGRDCNLSNKYLCTCAQGLSVFVQVSYAAGICDVSCLTSCAYFTGPWGLLIHWVVPLFSGSVCVSLFSNTSQARFTFAFPFDFYIGTSSL